MEPFDALDTKAIVLPQANIDTDQLIPARFLKRPRAEGYGHLLLHDMRRDSSGAPRDNPLDHPIRAGAALLIARRNFGCGSSREGAVYALADFGIRCVAAPSFGDIFASNAVKNSLLPAQVSVGDAEALLTSPVIAAAVSSTSIFFFRQLSPEISSYPSQSIPSGNPASQRLGRRRSHAQRKGSHRSVSGSRRRRPPLGDAKG